MRRLIRTIKESVLKKIKQGTNRTLILSVLFLVAFSGGIVAFATPPTSPYLQNETLDPTCAPGDAECFVEIPDASITDTGLVNTSAQSFAGIKTFTSTVSGSSGSAYGHYIHPTVSQSGTAAYIGLLVNVTEGATGSGTHYLADFQVDGASKLNIDSEGNVTAARSFAAGGGTIFPNVVGNFSGNTDSYLQVNIQNLNDGDSASSDFVATADDGDDDSYYVDLGINSSGYNDLSLIYGGPHTAYLYTSDSDLVIGTAGATESLKFFTGGDANANERMRISSTGYVGVGDTSPASLFTVGSGDKFQVDSSGNIVKLNNVVYSFPSSQGASSSYLKNNGSGTLSWQTLDFVPTSYMGAVSGVATLDSSGKVPMSQLSSLAISDIFVVASQAAMLALSSAGIGDLAIRTDTNTTYVLSAVDYSNVSNWVQILTPTDSVLSVNGEVGAINLSTTEIDEGTNLYYTNSRADARISLQKGVADGIATLDGNGKVPTSQLASLSFSDTYVVASQVAMLALSATQGDLAIRTDQSKTYVLADTDATVLANWVEILNGASVTSVNGSTGSVTLTTSNITEGSNQYFTDARARSAISVAGSIPLSYSNSTGIMTISQATGSVSGYLSATDWTTFNSKQSSLTFSSPLSNSSGTISITNAAADGSTKGAATFTAADFNATSGLIAIDYTNGQAAATGAKGFLTSTDWNTFNGKLTLPSLDTGSVLFSNGTTIAKNGNFFWDDGAESLGIGIASPEAVLDITSSTSGVLLPRMNTTRRDDIVTPVAGELIYNTDDGEFQVYSGVSWGAVGVSGSGDVTADAYNNVFTGTIGAGAALNGAGGGVDNILFGDNTGDSITTGVSNILLGKSAGAAITTASYNTAIGYRAGEVNTTGTENIFIGSTAGSVNTTGDSNVFIGGGAGMGNTTADGNTFVGDIAGKTNSTGTGNAFFGKSAGRLNTEGNNNTFIGYLAGDANTTAGDNTFVGMNAGLVSTGGTNSFFGKGAGVANTTATGNTFLGYSAGATITTGGNNILIGDRADVSSNSITRSIVIGSGTTAVATANDQWVVSTGSGTAIDAYFGNGVTSASPQGIIINASGGSGTNQYGAGLNLASGKATGNAVGGAIAFLTSDAGASGTTLQTLTEKWRVTAEGHLNGANRDLGDGAAGNYITLGRNTNATNTGAGSINFQKKSGTAGYVWQDNSGNMRIHTAAPTNANDTAGTVIGTQTSTRDTKQNIEDYTDYTNALQLILDAPLHTFRYRNEVEGYGTDSPLAKVRIGYIADEVNPAFMWGNVIDQVSVNGILMAAVKQLDIKITNIADLTNEDNSLVGALRAWLASTTNGLVNIFSDKITTKELCVEDVCINKDQLRALIENAGQTLPPSGGGETPPTEEVPPSETPPTGTPPQDTPSSDIPPTDENPPSETPPAEQTPPTDTPPSDTP